MRGDVRIRIFRAEDGVTTTIWSCRAQVMKLAPADAEVDDAIAVADVQARFRFHYTAKLDDVLRSPENYNVEVLTRVAPTKTIRAIQQSVCGRYVELSL